MNVWVMAVTVSNPCVYVCKRSEPIWTSVLQDPSSGQKHWRLNPGNSRFSPRFWFMLSCSRLVDQSVSQSVGQPVILGPFTVHAKVSLGKISFLCFSLTAYDVLFLHPYWEFCLNVSVWGRNPLGGVCSSSGMTVFFDLTSLFSVNCII